MRIVRSEATKKIALIRPPEGKSKNKLFLRCGFVGIQILCTASLPRLELIYFSASKT
jgi:hypothetical protein